MNEQLNSSNQLPSPTVPERERLRAPLPAPQRETPDWRRFEVAARRFGELIATGITEAMEQQRDVDEGTARCIAHVLGRSLGRHSALADFARTGEGEYESLREEYLSLHNHEGVTASTQELIDWLGTHLIRQQHPDAKTIHYEAVYPPRLDNILVPTGVEVGDWYFTVHVPGIYGSTGITELSATLAELSADQDAALRAFLGLSDVNAMSGDIMQDFHDNFVGVYRDKEEALHEITEVDERERDLIEYAAERHLFIEQVSPDYEALAEEVADGYDIVEAEGRAYVFYK